MTFLLFFLVQFGLPSYSVTVDPVLLEMLYENFLEDIEVPATVVLNDSLESECTLSFRGATSLWLPKKSWHIAADEKELFPGGGRILLNAHYRDPTMMRNTLGLLITRELGYPAPLTEFVTLTINDQYFGVYERVERIDRNFYHRNGLGFGPLFKNVDTIGRLACQYADTSGTTGLEPRVDSQPYGNMVVQMIDRLFFGDTSIISEEEVVAAMAVNTAIFDRDGLIKNFYVHNYLGLWHYYPWDRDATFGSSWEGIYNPDWLEMPGMGDMGYFGPARAILSRGENTSLYNQLLLETSELMTDMLPDIVDSLRLLIGESLLSDPWHEYTGAAFDSACAVLAGDIALRGEYLSTATVSRFVVGIDSISIPDPLDLTSPLTVEVQLADEAEVVVMLISLDGGDESWGNMTPETGNRWVKTFFLPPDTYSVRFVFGPVTEYPSPPMFYPGWSMRDFGSRPLPSPGARVALAGLYPELLVPGPPVWCGENLWVLPVKNTSLYPQDISLCSFYLGNPMGTVFMPESTLIGPGETFLLTSNAGEARWLFPGETVFGDAGAPFPGGTQLLLNDPAWNQIHTWQISQGDSLEHSNRGVVPSELSVGCGPDWIELFNTTSRSRDLSGWYFTDQDMNVSLIPHGTVIQSGGMVLAAVEPQSFAGAPCPVIPLDFGLAGSGDTLSLFTSLGDLYFRIGYDSRWPSAKTGIMYLRSPSVPPDLPYSWAAADPPGTPGEPNPGWLPEGSYTTLDPVRPNPSRGNFVFSYRSSSSPLEAILYDMTGRVMARMELSEPQGTVTADFSGILPSGVYFLYLRSSTGADSVRLTVLKE